MTAPHDTLDLTGLKCPLPALIARRAPGASIAVLTDDPMAPIDVPHMCREEGFEVITAKRDGERARFVLRRPRAA